MDLRDMQKEVDEWVKPFNPPYWPPHQQLARLTEETGEVAREINNLHGVKKRKPGEPEGNLGQELSDVIFTVVCLANSHEVDLDAEWKKMMDQKMYGRDKDRYEKK